MRLTSSLICFLVCFFLQDEMWDFLSDSYQRLVKTQVLQDKANSRSIVSSEASRAESLRRLEQMKQPPVSLNLYLSELYPF
jgi:hypothetical protein